MEQIKWPTTSIWFDETLELFRCIEDDDNPVTIAKKIKGGTIFGDMKEATAKRKWGTINARYFGQGEQKNEHPDWTIKNIVTSALENNIYGADIQREPLQITALNLWIKAKSYAVKARIDELNLFNINVLMANSLYPWETEEEFHQMSIFDTPETISEKKFTSEDIGRLISSRNAINHNNAVRFFKQKFDIVVMNPPFVDTRNMPQETKETEIGMNSYFIIDEKVELRSLLIMVKQKEKCTN